MVFAFLTGYTLLSQPNYAGAQSGGAPWQPINQLVTTVQRSPPTGKEPAPSIAKSGGVSGESLKTCCEKILRDGQRIYYLNSRNGKMRLQIRGIYARGATLFFVLRLNNRSSLDYDVDSIRFFVAEKDSRRSPPLRLNELSPVYVYDTARLVKGYGRATSVIVLPRFTLARGRRLLIEVIEKNGGRQLQVQASNFTLENARLI